MWSDSPVIVILLFLLRIGVPLAVTLGLAYLYDRLAARWERASVPPAEPQPRAGCRLGDRARAATTRWPNTPCWLALEITEGQMPDECLLCPLFRESGARAQAVRS